ncbi:hypothetical protein LEL_01505 [Akanthomyces lecanii RCEF 1005]|uniref:Cell wall galactomannoprotein n=1 Tax=Akanthomyces lecanii RCEF 1005 TaxID=1081108 RepID=A0A168KPB2_CORDF|nr:hypothetical protein LEL_01505 [Akanthomyces lecanii RCEF 1005]
MKAVFATIATLALSVFAAPAAAEVSAVAVRSAAVAQPEFAVLKRDQTAEDLIDAINKATDNINTIGVSINVTITKVKSGAISKPEGIKLVNDELQKLLKDIGDIGSQFLAAARVAVSKETIKVILKAVEAWFRAAVSVFNAVLINFSGSITLSFTIHVAFSLFVSFLTGLAGVFGKDIVPGLLAIFQGFVNEFKGSAGVVLGPFLKFIIHFLQGLPGGQ